jgi:hypothetical protein
MRKFLAFVLALFIAIPLLIGAFVLISIQPWAVNRDFYKKALTDDKLYSGIQAVPKADPKATLEVGEFTFNTNSFQAGLAAALPKEEIKKFSGNSIDVIFDALEGKSGGADTIDVEPLKASLRANSKKFVSAYVEALPAGESDKPAATDFSSLPKGITRAKYASLLNPLVSKALEDNFAKVDSKLSIESVRSTRKGMPFAKNLKTSFAISMLGNIAVAFALWNALAQALVIAVALHGRRSSLQFADHHLGRRRRGLGGQFPIRDPHAAGLRTADRMGRIERPGTGFQGILRQPGCDHDTRLLHNGYHRRLGRGRTHLHALGSRRSGNIGVFSVIFSHAARFSGPFFLPIR